MNRIKRRAIFLFLLVFAASGAGLSLWANNSRIGDKACLECHEELMGKYKNNVHYRLHSFEVKGIGEKGCESCHGPGKAHAEEGDPAKIFSFKKATPDQSSAACLSCHKSLNTSDWNLSDHAMGEVSCTKCHTVHTGKSLRKPEPQLCMSCHKDIKAKSYYPSHHPMREGKMKCSSCHQHHGSLVRNLKTNERLNDLCLKCHADKRGPFVFEHAPVTEDCMTCHNPHGTVANNLLKQNEPFLCLQCHESHFHAGRESSDVPRTLPSTGYTGMNPHGAEGWRKAFLTKCTQCHFKIHGSDSPSQSVSGQGKSMTR